jgi:crossover junction endodeoxyribonuclease RuvC
MSGAPIMGVDPGVTGAIAFYYPVISRISVYDVPLAGGEIDAPNLAALIKNYNPSLAIIERVSAMPKNGAVSMFNFGRSYGDVRGVVGALNIPLHLVSPQKWKKHFGLSSDKDQSRMLAIRMFPTVAEHFKLKKHDGRAEAALIAKYGAEVLMVREVA